MRFNAVERLAVPFVAPSISFRMSFATKASPWDSVAITPPVVHSLNQYGSRRVPRPLSSVIGFAGEPYGAAVATAVGIRSFSLCGTGMLASILYVGYEN